jgi:uncharacterized protein YbjT (DUF2867 family)
MKVTIFGATGLLGRECLSRCLEAGHEVRVLVRTASKLPAELRNRITIIEGGGLDPRAPMPHIGRLPSHRDKDRPGLGADAER